MISINPFNNNDPYSLVVLISKTNIVYDDALDADQMPLLAARVSHGNDDKTGKNEANDIKLMNFLAQHKHMTPFEHTHATFKIVCPLFVAREWHRHRTQSYNEISMRYTSDPVGKFWLPDESNMRVNATRNKQSSSGNLPPEIAAKVTKDLKVFYQSALDLYNKLINEYSLAREQARCVVPVGNYTEFYATANLRNWAHFANLRCAEDAQMEIRCYANTISDILSKIYPNTWKTLCENVVKKD